jgi:hypothetical protein
MSTAPSRSVALFGTEEPVEPPLVLTAGPLSAELEDGNLRYIRFSGREMLRAVSYIVRDKNWGTYRPRITNLVVEEGEESFHVGYDAVAGDDQQSFRYRARIHGHADGSLVFEATGEAQTDFLTNRTGFVVLHPIAGVAGEPCTIEHVDGRVVQGRFPALIDPVQPMMDLRALTHSFAPGFKVTCRMEGDTFEMEDQRNWTDASYKTYVRPLALPWPYTLAKGTRLDQRVMLSVTGRGELTGSGKGVALCANPGPGPMPALGFAVAPQDAIATRAAAALLEQARPHHVVCFHDPREGHDAATLASQVEAARAVGAEPWLEAVIASVEGFGEEVAALGRVAAELGNPFTTVLVSPAPDLKCVLPGSPWPPCPDARELLKATRAAFPKARLGGGMFSFFTELNRKRPQTDLLDFVSFTTSPLVHAGDDRSASESIEALPAIADSVKSFIQGRPWHVGPSAIGMRMNPYGAAPMENPNNIRQAMNRMDPRQRGLFGAAWAVGYVAQFARAGAEALTINAGTGEFGLVHAPAGHKQPWYDDHPGTLYPVFHVFRGLAGLKGAPILDIDCSRGRDVQAIGALSQTGQEAWIANLTGERQSVSLWGSLEGRLALLDEAAFVEAARDPAFMDRATRSFSGSSLDLGPYAVARLIL